MVHVICGMIGAGKSVFAGQNYRFVTECENGDKPSQIAETQRIEMEFGEVAHVTTFPTASELDAFPDAEYIWINTEYQKCYENILARGRIRDFVDIGETLKANKDIRSRYYTSDLRFRVIDIFDSGERW